MRKWRVDLWLEDDQIAPAMDLLRGLIRRFEAKYGDLENACASRQWKCIKSLLDGNCLVFQPNGGNVASGVSAHPVIPKSQTAWSEHEMQTLRDLVAVTAHNAGGDVTDAFKFIS